MGGFGTFVNAMVSLTEKRAVSLLSADTGEVEPFRQVIKDLIKSESLNLSHIYSADERQVFSFELFLKIPWHTDMKATCRAAFM
jgi:hypothetical protein